MRILSCNI